MQYPYLMRLLQCSQVGARGLIPMLLSAGLLCTSTAFAATPDFSGIWANAESWYVEAPAEDDEGEGVHGETDYSEESGIDDVSIGDVEFFPGGMPSLKEPYAKEFKADLDRRAKAVAQGIELVDSSTRCLPSGMPSMMGASYDIEILQTPVKIVVIAEYLSEIRRVYLNEEMPPLEEISPSYSGHSVGNWEGDTLVIKTMGVREDVEFMGIPHSAHMQITERWRMTSPEDFENHVRIDDPVILAEPYEYSYRYTRDKGYRVVEYICDNNRNSIDAEGRVDLVIPTTTN